MAINSNISVNFKKVFRLMQKLVEEIFPVCMFVILFLTFVIEVIARYIFRYPLSWYYDVVSISYTWLVVMGACYTERKKSHVQFTLLYDAVKPKAKAILVILGDLIILVTFIILFIPATKYIFKMKIQSTSVLNITFKVIYFPFIFFMIIIIGNMVAEIIQILKNISKEGDNTDEH